MLFPHPAGSPTDSAAFPCAPTLCLSPADFLFLPLSLSLSQFPSPARPSTSSLSLPPTFAPLTPSLSNRARSAAVLYPHHRRIHGPPPLLLTPLVRLSPSCSPHPEPSFSGYPHPAIFREDPLSFSFRHYVRVSSLSDTALSLYTRREWGEVSCSSNIPSTIHNRSMLARGDQGPKVDVHVRGSFNEIKLQVLDTPKVCFFIFEFDGILRYS